jgi:2-dehydropantoate 2-reductase
MRILVVGAGAIGGHFGGKLLKGAKCDLPRAASTRGRTRDFGPDHKEHPPAVLAEDLREPYDLTSLSCKAYDLASAIESIASAVGQRH